MRGFNIHSIIMQALKRPSKRLTMMALAVVWAGYVGAYAQVRSQRWLVHRSGYAHGMTDSHSIAVGDLGPGWNANYEAARAGYIVFAPLRWCETACWYWRHPAGEPWPYARPQP